MVWLLFAGKKALARRAATSFSMTLSRGLTNAAFVEYLEADERMAPLAVCLVDDTVLGDTLIDAIMQFKSGMVSS